MERNLGIKTLTPEKIALLSFELGQCYENQENLRNDIFLSMSALKDGVDLRPSQYPKEWAWEWSELRELIPILVNLKLLTPEEAETFTDKMPEK